MTLKRLEPDIEQLAKQAVILHARFKKAQALATLLADEGITYAMTVHMTEDAWDVATRAARLKSSSVLTRVLAMEVMRDREKQKALLRLNGWPV